MRKIAAIFIFIIMAACASAFAQEDKQSFTAVNISAVETDEAPTLDGVLDDACWQNCAKYTGFRDTDHNRDATNSTEAMICYDQKNLYIAFMCYDAQPSLIKAQQKQRDCGLGSDDRVSVIIDTLHNHLDSYSFSVNPLGTQDQNIPFASADNITWRGDWHTAAKINDKGWCAEMAIPFRTLRYPTKGDTFGIAFTRAIPRISEDNVWPDVGTNWDMKRYADLSNLKLPKQKGWPVFMPYTISSRQPGDSMNRMGFDFKEEFPNNIIALATYNPDFTDIQDSVSSIAFSHTERYQSEYRPFFQEGYGLFPDRSAFYSRRISDIDAGIKTFGKVGPSAFAFMSAMKPGQESHFASTYARDFGQDAGFAGFFAGSNVKDMYKQDPDEPDESLCVSPGAFRRWRGSTGTTTLACRQYIAINSGRPSASSMNLSLGKSSIPRHLGYNIYYGMTDEDYYVRDSYVPVTGTRGLTSSLNYYDQPASGPFEYWEVWANAGRTMKQGGGLHNESLSTGVDLSTRHEWSFGTSFQNGTWLGARDSTVSLYAGWLNRHLYQGGSISCTTGIQGGEDYLYVSLGQSFKVTEKLRFYGDYEWSRWSSMKQSQFSVSSNYQFTPERGIGIWAVGRDSELNMCLTYSQTVSSGSDIYLIYGEPNADSTQQRLALKIVTPIAF